MTENVHTLVGAYALDAVTGDEREHFESHLHTCVACREELESLQATAAKLGAAAAVAPSLELRNRVLAAAISTPQERPRIATVLPGPWQRWAPRLLAAASVLAVVASLGAFLVERERVQEVEEQQATMAAVLAAPDAEEQALQLDGGAKLRVVTSPSVGQTVVVSSDMPEPGPGKDYEVWSVGADGPESAGIMEPGPAGSARTQLIDHADDATALAITVEPEGGSPEGEPTSEPIVTVALA